MVGKLNDMVAAGAVVFDSAKTKPVGEQDFAQVRPVSTQAPSSSTLKSLDTLTDKQKEEQAQEGQLQPGTMSEESVKEATETLNELMDKINCNIKFNYNREANVLNVKMIDKDTNEVIKEFPPEEMIKNMIKAKEWLGAFIDKAV